MLETPQIKYQGYYTIHVCRPDGRVRESRYFHNLITNTGLDSVVLQNMAVIDVDGTKSLTRFCGVGSGTTPPTFGDTSLELPVGSYVERTLYSIQLKYSYARDATGNDYWTVTPTYRFPPLGHSATITEITTCALSGSKSVFSRALITNASGTLQPIFLADDEYLDVAYELRCYFDMRPRRFAMPLNGTIVTGTRTIAGYTYGRQIESRGPRIDQGPGGKSINGIITVNAATIYPVSIPAPAPDQPLPSGTPSTAMSIDVNTGIGPYVPGQYWIDNTFTSSISQNNFATGIKTIAVIDASGNWYYEFDQPIMKKNTQTFSLTVRYSWGRLASSYTGLPEPIVGGISLTAGVLA